ERTGAMMKQDIDITGEGEGGGLPVKEPGMGMKFVAITDRDLQRIRSFIKSQITKDIHAP
ncbi:MAG TPA: hypothetical protein VLG39_10980, partial [Nitrospirota bacterium]|nr:hypothetical protein [Nitrospirota bacterium]